MLIWAWALAGVLSARAQARAVWDYDPDTVQVLIFDYDSQYEAFKSNQPLFRRVAVRTITDSTGGYTDRMVELNAKRVLLSVRHASGRAVLSMHYPDGTLRLRAGFLEDTLGPAPTAFFVPSLRRPLSAYAALDGEVQTFYRNGALRQVANYRLGKRITSQCFDFRNRLVDCNANPLIIPATLPKKVTSNHSFTYQAVGRAENSNIYRSTASKAQFVHDTQGELRKLLILLPRQQISAESVALVTQRGEVPINFMLAPNTNGSHGTGITSGALNGELRSIALSAGRLFAPNAAERITSAIIDGESVALYFTLPVQFGLK
ncbi:hypothetical protein ACFST9_03280 [Hymenobacter monticola]|uniref:Uncharacterized protein n=1 Tax=Hymenobacter monticola TaxID=1705399 RepID=A0ABY4B1I8_9BACT|nr:hypothetical protein [Hymenobacter monticola]UOE33020.1 hypothetical protein MTP16_18045 [Hymenobacter monticola]